MGEAGVEKERGEEEIKVVGEERLQEAEGGEETEGSKNVGRKERRGVQPQEEHQGSTQIDEGLRYEVETGSEVRRRDGQ